MASYYPAGGDSDDDGEDYFEQMMDLDPSDVGNFELWKEIVTGQVDPMDYAAMLYDDDDDDDYFDPDVDDASWMTDSEFSDGDDMDKIFVTLADSGVIKRLSFHKRQDLDERFRLPRLTLADQIESYESVYKVLDEILLLLRTWKKRINHAFTAHIQREDVRKSKASDLQRIAEGEDYFTEDYASDVASEVSSDEVKPEAGLNVALTKKKFCNAAKLFYDIFESDRQFDGFVANVARVKKHVFNVVFALFSEALPDHVSPLLPNELWEKVWKFTQDPFDALSERFEAGIRSKDPDMAAIENERITDLFGAAGNLHMVIFEILFKHPRISRIPPLVEMDSSAFHRKFSYAPSLFWRFGRDLKTKFARLQELKCEGEPLSEKSANHDDSAAENGAASAPPTTAAQNGHGLTLTEKLDRGTLFLRRFEGAELDDPAFDAMEPEKPAWTGQPWPFKTAALDYHEATPTTSLGRNGAFAVTADVENSVFAFVESRQLAQALQIKIRRDRPIIADLDAKAEAEPSKNDLISDASVAEKNAEKQEPVDEKERPEDEKEVEKRNGEDVAVVGGEEVDGKKSGDGEVRADAGQSEREPPMTSRADQSAPEPQMTSRADQSAPEDGDVRAKTAVRRPRVAATVNDLDLSESDAEAIKNGLESITWDIDVGGYTVVSIVEGRTNKTVAVIDTGVGILETFRDPQDNFALLDNRFAFIVRDLDKKSDSFRLFQWTFPDPIAAAACVEAASPRKLTVSDMGEVISHRVAERGRRAAAAEPNGAAGAAPDDDDDDKKIVHRSRRTMCLRIGSIGGKHHFFVGHSTPWAVADGDDTAVQSKVLVFEADSRVHLRTIELAGVNWFLQAVKGERALLTRTDFAATDDCPDDVLFLDLSAAKTIKTFSGKELCRLAGHAHAPPPAAPPADDDADDWQAPEQPSFCSFSAMFDARRDKKEFLVFSKHLSAYRLVDYEGQDLRVVSDGGAFVMDLSLNLAEMSRSSVLFDSTLYISSCRKPIHDLADGHDMFFSETTVAESLDFGAWNVAKRTAHKIAATVTEPQDLKACLLNDYSRRTFNRLSEKYPRAAVPCVVGAEQIVFLVHGKTHFLVDLSLTPRQVLELELQENANHRKIREEKDRLKRIKKEQEEQEKKRKEEQRAKEAEDKKALAAVAIQAARDKYLKKKAARDKYLNSGAELTGRIINWQQSYGFIDTAGDDAKCLGNVFVHISSVTNRGKRWMRRGMAVQFKLKEGRDEAQVAATAVRIVDDADVGDVGGGGGGGGADLADDHQDIYLDDRRRGRGRVRGGRGRGGRGRGRGGRGGPGKGRSEDKKD